MDLNPLYAAILAGVGGTLWVLFTATGKAVFAWIAKPYTAWRQARRDSAQRRERMEIGWDDHTNKVDKFMAENLESKARTTDLFKAITDRLDNQDLRSASDREILADIFSMTQGQFDTSPVARFVCDAKGRNLQVNAEYTRLVGVGRDDMIGMKWQRFIHPKYLVGHLEGFARAQAGHYEYDDEIILLPPQREPIRVRVHMIPHPRDLGPATRWAGTVVPI